MRTLLLVALALFLGTAAGAQDDPVGCVRLVTNAPEARLLVDGEPVERRTDGLVCRPPSDEAVLALIEARPDAWQPRRAEATVAIAGGDTAEVRLDLPLRYRIETVPVGATVTLETGEGARVLGTAPLWFDHDGPLDGSLVAAMPGFLSARMAPGDSLVNRHTLWLRPLVDRAFADAASGWLPPSRSTSWMVYVLAGLAFVSAGIALIYNVADIYLHDR